MNDQNKKRLDRINEITDILDSMVVDRNITMEQRREYSRLAEERSTLSREISSSGE